ncbi:hypothetical protein BBFGKLBO_00623 [Synechococcus sp. CBW1107]|nr:hypothetical protein BBFGKLBO_00623 [Synechococcus sp. CBW1107]
MFSDEATRCDVFFITLKKSERLFSPTTRTNDVAISPLEFHWENQSLTREASSTGRCHPAVSLPRLCRLREPPGRAASAHDEQL